jgi:ribosomal protein S18 acetylase RimI-like enzyme
MTFAPTFAPAARNLAATMASFAYGIPGARVAENPAFTLVDTGKTFGAFNSAILREEACERAFVESLDGTAEYFAAQGSPWSYWVCEGFLEAPLRRQLTRVFAKRKLQHTSSSPGMFATQLAPRRRPLPSLPIRRVGDPATIRGFCHLMAVTFDGPSRELGSMYRRPELWTQSHFRGYLGSVRGFDVTGGITVVAGGVIGLYAVATLPEFMRRGYGEALMRYAIEDTQADYGPMPIVLQSSPIALKLYRRMGFQQTAQFSLYST